MLTQDWTMRELETLTRSLSRFIFGKDTTAYAPGEGEEIAPLALELDLLLNGGDFNGAEDRLFQAIDDGDQSALELAVDLYARLNQLSDDRLKAGDYSRGEIEEGLREVMDRYGVVLP